MLYVLYLILRPIKNRVTFSEALLDYIIIILYTLKCVQLSIYKSETFTVQTSTDQITYRKTSETLTYVSVVD